MLFQVGGQGTRPTFFEMSAAQQLPASLRAALTYSIGVLALRRPFLHKVLDHEDEFFSLLMLVLETHSLRITDASFAESLYGLRRRTVKIRVKKEDVRPNSGDGIQQSGLEKHQRILSVVFLVALPYLKSKLHSIYNKEREARLQASLWGNGDETVEDAEYFSGGESSLVSREVTIRSRLMKKIQKIMFVCYPWLHASSEGMSFAYQLLYLLDATGFYSLGLHALGIHVCRATGQELMDTSSRISKIRSNERERLHGPPWLKALQRALLSCTYTMLDYAQTGLIAAVFFFKMMEWWYQSAEERMSAPTVYPPPPPPPAPKIDERVQREIMNHRSFKHPNTIRFKEVLLTPTHLVIVMEYAAAGELFDGICNAGRFSEDEVDGFHFDLMGHIMKITMDSADALHLKNYQIVAPLMSICRC